MKLDVNYCVIRNYKRINFFPNVASTIYHLMLYSHFGIKHENIDCSARSH